MAGRPSHKHFVKWERSCEAFISIGIRCKAYALTGQLFADDLHQFRLLQRRFIVYRSSKAGNARWHASTGESPHPSMRSAHSQLTADSSQAGDAVAATAADSAAVGECKTATGKASIQF